VVLLNGARQTGKSTLVQEIARADYDAPYLTLDDATVLAAARSDSDGFVRSFDGLVVIDEVQHAPDLFRAIKVVVDKDRRPGRFLLTGSADVLLLPIMSESLVGRIEIITLWSFSQGELNGRKERFVDALFRNKLPSGPTPAQGAKRDLWKRIISGGYPEVTTRPSSRRRQAWFKSYITTILQRDMKQITWSKTLPTLHHFRMPSGREVDLVMEDASGRLVGVEVKAGSGVSNLDFKGLRAFADICKEKFHRGVLLHTGDEVVPFGPKQHAVPIESLWLW